MFTMFVKVPYSIIAISCGFFEGATQADFALLGENREHPHFRDQIKCTLQREAKIECIHTLERIKIKCTIWKKKPTADILYPCHLECGCKNL